MATHVGRQTESLPVREGEEFVVIQDTVLVLHPLRVHVAIKDDPLPLVQFTTHVVNDPGDGGTGGKEISWKVSVSE